MGVVVILVFRFSVEATVENEDSLSLKGRPSYMTAPSAESSQLGQ